MSIKVGRNLRDAKIKSLSQDEIDILSKAGIKDNEETLQKLKDELKSTNTAADATNEKVTVLETSSNAISARLDDDSETLDALAKTIALSLKQVLPDSDATANMQTTYFRDRSWFSSDDNFIEYNFTTNTQCETAPEDLGYQHAVGKALNVPDMAITTTADHMFYQSNYSKIPPLNTPKLTSADSMFMLCSYLKEIPEMNFSKITNANQMFALCTEITTTPKLNFKTHPVASYMFYGCTNLKEVKIDNSKTYDEDYNSFTVTNPIGMFYNCKNLNYNMRVYLDDSTESTKGMFYGCKSQKNIPIDNYSYYGDSFHTNLTNMSMMFMGCSSMTDFSESRLTTSDSTDTLLPDSELKYWSGTSAVTDMSYIFADCVSLEATPKFDCTSVTNFTGAFRNCKSLGNIRMINIKADLDISDCHGFDYSTTYKLIHTCLAEVEETRTLTINEDTMKYMYQSDIDDATAKGWTIAVK